MKIRLLAAAALLAALSPAAAVPVGAPAAPSIPSAIGACSVVTYSISANAFGCNPINMGVGGYAPSVQSLAIGTGALASAQKDQNMAIGWHALYLFQTGTSGNGGNVAVGQQALSSLVVGQEDTAVGQYALANSTASGNTAVGQGVMQNSTSGANSVAMGWGALYLNTTGSYNTAIGYGALYSDVAGNNNVGVGQDVLYNTNAGANTALGYLAGEANTSGGHNLFLGYSVGSAVSSTGSRNVFIGTASNCDAAADPTSDTFLLCASSGATPLLQGTLASGSLGLTVNGPLNLPAAPLAKASGGTGATSGAAAAANLSLTYALCQQNTQVSHTGDTSEVQLFSCAIPAGTLGANGALRLTFDGTYTANTDSKTYRVRYGTTNDVAGTQFVGIGPITTATNSGLVVRAYEIANRNSAAAQQGMSSYVPGAGAYTTVTTSFNTATTTTYLVVSGQLGTASDSIALEHAHVEIIPAGGN